MKYEDQIQDIVNKEIDQEVESRINNYPVYVKINGKDVDIKSIDFSGGEINIELHEMEVTA